jgi:hypothetical protein
MLFSDVDGRGERCDGWKEWAEPVRARSAKTVVDENMVCWFLYSELICGEGRRKIDGWRNDGFGSMRSMVIKLESWSVDVRPQIFGSL